ncbi:MAG: hypothetical protein H0U60_18400 [Blastocatellia bacterium]|nr:hypothetical protein [Blastocatellia bacterium]
MAKLSYRKGTAQAQLIAGREGQLAPARAPTARLVTSAINYITTAQA